MLKFIHNVQNRIPLILTVLGWLYIFGTVFYYFYFCYVYNWATKHTDFYNVLSVLNYHNNNFIFIQNIIIMIVTPVVGIGLITKRKWGLFLFVIYGLFLIFLNIANLIVFPARLNVWWWIPNIITIGLLLLFVRLELRAPFYRPDWEIRDQRHKHKVPVKYKIVGNDNYIEAKTEDISENGCYISSEEKHNCGESLEIILDPNGHKLFLEGQVVWINDNDKHKKGFGVMFVHLGGKTFDEILEIIVV